MLTFSSLSVKLYSSKAKPKQNQLKKGQRSIMGYKFDTQKIRAGYEPSDNQQAVSPPIYQTASYDFKSTDHAQNLFTYKEAGYLYTRVGNPTVTYFAERVKALDGGKNVVAVGSGITSVSPLGLSSVLTGTVDEPMVPAISLPP